MKKFRVLLLAVVVAVTMMAGSLAAFAADATPATDAQKFSADAAHVTKTLKSNKGFAKEFTFKFDAVAAATDTSTIAETPELTIADIVLNKTANDDNMTSTDTQGKFTFKKGSDTGAAAFPHAGVYKYTVTENATTSTQAGTNEKMTFATNSYTIYVYVKNGANGLEIEAITATDSSDEKVTEIGFENTFTKTTGEEGITVSKTVSGGSGDLTKKFDFTVVVTEPSEMNGEAYAATTTPSEGVEVVYDADAHTHTYTFSLAHGEQVEFKNLPIGATYTVSEAGADNYTATATVDGTRQAAGEKGQGTTTTSTLVDADGSTTAVDNEAEDITVTGVIMNILPFVMMIAIGGAAAAMYVVSRRRKMAR